MIDQPRSGSPLAFTAWAMLSGAAWSIGSHLLLGPGISDPNQIHTFALDIALQAVPTAVLLGAGGAFVLRRFLRNPLLWAASVLIGLPVGVTVGLLLDAAFLYRQVHSMGMVLSGEGGTAFMWTSPAIDLTIAGFILAVCQLPSLARGLASRPARAALWVLGTAASLGVGWFLSAALADTSGQSSVWQGAAMGLVSGSLIFGLLLAMERETSGA